VSKKKPFEKFYQKSETVVPKRRENGEFWCFFLFDLVEEWLSNGGLKFSGGVVMVFDCGERFLMWLMVDV
jgi:hypothetical protein